MDDRHGSHISSPDRAQRRCRRTPDHQTDKANKRGGLRRLSAGPRSGTEFFQLANEMLADRSSLEVDSLAEPSYSGEGVTFDWEVAAWLKVLKLTSYRKSPW